MLNFFAKRITACLIGFACASFALSQAKPQLSPEWQAFYAAQNKFRTRGTTALTTEYAREKTGDCPNAASTVEIRNCLQAEINTTQNNYQIYLRSIGGLLRLKAPGDIPPPRAAQPPDIGKDFDLAESAWSTYRDQQCEAVSDQFYGGTMRGGAELTCKQELTRRHMHELESVYRDLWH
jgi:uncharacterized protein YecT (DUF1311 family)